MKDLAQRGRVPPRKGANGRGATPDDLVPLGPRRRLARPALGAGAGRDGEQRCNQCWKFRPVSMFISRIAPRGGHPILGKNCSVCRAKYSGWSRKSFDEKLALRRKRPVLGTGYRVGFVLRSGNRKLGGLPASTTDRASCPTTCALRDHGCYAEYHQQRAQWERVGRRGMSWAAFCREIERLPPGTLWRHNEAGDLPGAADHLDATALRLLVASNRGRRGFTFSHKHGDTWARRAIAEANADGFTINLSADSLEQADELADYRIAPVAVVVALDAPDRLRTPAGRRVVICPNQTRGLTCAECQLCAKPQRKTIVGFRAHGQYQALVSQLVRARRTA